MKVLFCRKIPGFKAIFARCEKKSARFNLKVARVEKESARLNLKVARVEKESARLNKQTPPFLDNKLKLGNKSTLISVLFKMGDIY